MSMKQRLDFFRSANNTKDNNIALRRITSLVERDSFTAIETLTKSGDSLAGVVAGVGRLNGKNVCIFSQDSSVNGGALNSEQAEKILKLFELAETTGTPIIGIYDSKGACLTDENSLLNSISKLLAKTNKISGVVPQISIILGACFGISAVLASSADFIVASKSAKLNVNAGDDQTDIADIAKEGSVTILADNDTAVFAQVKLLMSYLPQNNLSKPDILSAIFSKKNDFDTISNEIFEQKENINYDNFLSSFADAGNYIELQNEFGKSVSINFARLNGVAVGVVVFKGDSLDAEDCTKTARFVRFCDAFSIPVITFVDAKEFKSLKDASKLANAYCDATTAKISIITGKAFGSVFASTAMQGASSDFTFAWVSASVSAMNPVTAAIFYDGDKLKESANPVEDRKKLIKSYIQDKATPFNMADKGLLQNVIMPNDTRKEVSAILNLLESKRVSKLAKKHSNINL